MGAKPVNAIGWNWCHTQTEILCTGKGKNESCATAEHMYLLVFLFGLSACLLVCLFVCLSGSVSLTLSHACTSIDPLLPNARARSVILKAIWWAKLLKMKLLGRTQSLDSGTKWQHNFHISLFVPLILICRCCGHCWLFILCCLSFCWILAPTWFCHFIWTAIPVCSVAPRISWRWYIFTFLVFVCVCVFEFVFMFCFCWCYLWCSHIVCLCVASVPFNSISACWSWCCFVVWAIFDIIPFFFCYCCYLYQIETVNCFVQTVARFAFFRLSVPLSRMYC